jgi:hypothetical protein
LGAFGKPSSERGRKEALHRAYLPDRLAERLPVERPGDELGQMATVFNQTLGRPEQSFEKLRAGVAIVAWALALLVTTSLAGDVLRPAARREAGRRARAGGTLCLHRFNSSTHKSAKYPLTRKTRRC